MKVYIFIHYSKRKNNQTYTFFLILVFSKKQIGVSMGGIIYLYPSFNERSVLKNTHKLTKSLGYSLLFPYIWGKSSKREDCYEQIPNSDNWIPMLFIRRMCTPYIRRRGYV